MHKRSGSIKCSRTFSMQSSCGYEPAKLWGHSGVQGSEPQLDTTQAEPQKRSCHSVTILLLLCRCFHGSQSRWERGFTSLFSAPAGPGRADLTPAGEVHHHRGEGLHGVQEKDWEQVSLLASSGQHSPPYSCSGGL